MKLFRRASRDRTWQLQALQIAVLNFRDLLRKRGETDSLEWIVLALFHTAIFQTYGPRERDAERIRYRIACLLEHCWQHGDELPSKTHLSFDAAYKALGVELH